MRLSTKYFFSYFENIPLSHIAFLNKTHFAIFFFFVEYEQSASQIENKIENSLYIQDPLLDIAIYFITDRLNVCL